VCRRCALSRDFLVKRKTTERSALPAPSLGHTSLGPDCSWHVNLVLPATHEESERGRTGGKFANLEELPGVSLLPTYGVKSKTRAWASNWFPVQGNTKGATWRRGSIQHDVCADFLGKKKKRVRLIYSPAIRDSVIPSPYRSSRASVSALFIFLKTGFTLPINVHPHRPWVGRPGDMVPRPNTILLHFRPHFLRCNARALVAATKLITS
jgi:hypothetical protein